MQVSRSSAAYSNRPPIYSYKSNYPSNSMSFSRETQWSREGQTPERGGGESEFDGFRMIRIAGADTYRPRRFMHPEKANFMNTEPLPLRSNGPLSHPRPQVVDVLPSRMGSALKRPATVPVRPRPKPAPSSYAKWGESPLYQTTNRQCVPERHHYDKERYFGRTQDFTKGFVGGMYRNVSLSTSIPECPVLHHENFGYP